MTKREGRPKRHLWIPDTQIRPGVPLDHIAWIAKYAIKHKFDVIGCLGDWWDFPSLNGHEQPGSVPLEGARFADDLFVGNEAFRTLSQPIEAAIERVAKSHHVVWRPRLVFIEGNHEIRADRVASNNPKLVGTVGSDKCDTRGWERYPFLERVWVDDILVTHYLQNANSSKPIGGGVENRLTKVGCSFIQGHEQGFLPGAKVLASGRTIRGIIAGSCYLHRENYRGAQGQDHFRGVIVLNEVRGEGRFSFMDVTLDFLCREYEGMSLHRFMCLKYPGNDWNYLK